MREYIDAACPVCRSLSDWRQVGQTNQSSYSMGKGILGTVVLGPVGAVAGIGGKQKSIITYQCAKCNYMKTYHL